MFKKNNDANMFKCFVCDSDRCVYCVQAARYDLWKADGKPGGEFDGHIRYRAETKAPSGPKEAESNAPPSYEEVLALREEEEVLRMAQAVKPSAPVA